MGEQFEDDLERELQVVLSKALDKLCQWDDKTEKYDSVDVNDFEIPVSGILEIGVVSALVHEAMRAYRHVAWLASKNGTEVL